MKNIILAVCFLALSSTVFARSVYFNDYCVDVTELEIAANTIYTTTDGSTFITNAPITKIEPSKPCPEQPKLLPCHQCKELMTIRGVLCPKCMDEEF